AYKAALQSLREAEPDADPAARKAALEKAREQLLEVHRAVRGGRPRLPRARADARDKKLEEVIAAARADRAKRREERLASLKKAHGDTLEAAPVRQELLRHAWRIARLQRLLQISEAERRKKPIARIQELIEKEETLHQERLAKLSSA